ncbi:MAG: hypothetical protein ACLSUW_09265 [Akkermansia sp.]
MKWNTENPDALKLIFIANEPFNQGNVPYAPWSRGRNAALP